MKALLVLAAGLLLLVGGTISSATAHSIQGPSNPAYRTIMFPLARVGAHHLVMSRVRVRDTTDDTPTPTGTAIEPTPTVTSTGPSYPDGATLFQTSIQVFQAIRSAHVQLITVAVKPDVEKLSIKGIGDASCTGPSMKMTVNASDADLVNKNTLKASSKFQQKFKTTLAKSNVTKNVWKKVNGDNAGVFYKGNKMYFGQIPKNALSFPFPVDNPLACPNAPTSGGGTGGASDTFLDVVDAGPATFQKLPVWKVTLTDVRDDGVGDTLNIPITILVDQKNLVPYLITENIDDTADGITLVEKQLTTKIGEKFSLKSLPKVGSK